ncbi:hypothetical protein C6501_10725 [Candidatus Poribacteria bacterium]|nr:MAG: hypothetical protein C6501_10725 [Candidatus Poribacteria bacterium]
MTPIDVKDLLKTLIVEEGLPIDMVDMVPDQEYTASSGLTTQNRIKDVVHQWNKKDKVNTRQPWRSDLMKFYSKTDSESATKELLESFEVEALLGSIITEQNLQIRFIDHGFRLITLEEDDTSRYPVKMLHGGFRLEKRQEAKIQLSQLEGVANRFEMDLKKNRTKAKLFHRGFRLEKNSEANIPISQVEEIAKRIDDTLGINYRLDSCRVPRSENVFESTECTSANIRISLWRFPRFPKS